MITAAQLQASMPHASSALTALYIGPLNAAMMRFEINTERRVEHFLATIAHESGDLNFVEENLNYSAVGLMKTWPKRFPTLATASLYARNPQKIANKVYADRYGNGNEASGDGWLFRGAGLIQLTFEENQAKCAKFFRIAEKDVGNWLRTPEGACMSAAWFFATHGCNELADADDFDKVCDVINIGRKTDAIGDAIGYKDRLRALNGIREVIA